MACATVRRPTPAHPRYPTLCHKLTNDREREVHKMWSASCPPKYSISRGFSVLEGVRVTIGAALMQRRCGHELERHRYRAQKDVGGKTYNGSRQSPVLRRRNDAAVKKNDTVWIDRPHKVEESRQSGEKPKRKPITFGGLGHTGLRPRFHKIPCTSARTTPCVAAAVALQSLPGRGR